jgi:hypothetical protein
MLAEVEDTIESTDEKVVVPLEVLGALESGGIYLLRLVPSLK